MRASIVIATKDRKDDLHRAIMSAVRQTEPLEIIVMDDGSSDGTIDMVKSEFPQVRMHRSPVSLGYVAQRNQGASLCSGEVVFSIDDDAAFSTSHVVAQTLSGFSHPRVAVVAIPYVEEPDSSQEYQKAPDADGIWTTDSFRGTSHALRRDVFLKLGGYREHIIHQGEEMDFSIRLLDHGFVVRLGFGDGVIHREFPKRDLHRMDFYGRRNDILFVWRNVPMPYLPAHLLMTTFNGITCAASTKRPSAMIQGMLSGYSEIFSHRSLHQPVSQKAYRLHRLLRKRGPKALNEVESLLPKFD
jgi:glycosyltransferase involved in cell wall biosynthesis